MISLAIIEDKVEIRQPLWDFFRRQPDIYCSTVVDSVEKFWEEYDKEVTPEVILLDIGLPGISGLTAISLIKEKFPEADIIMLTIFDDAEKIFQAIQSGASGYLLKKTSLEEIKKGVVEVHSGGAPMSPSIARKVIKFFKSPKLQTNSKLTEKENQVVSYLVDGQSYKMIAANLGNSVETIKTHAKNIYKKLHVNSKSEVVAKVLKRKR